MRKPARIFVFVVLISAFTLPVEAKSHSGKVGSSADESAVRKVLSGLSAADKAGDLAAALSHYADDAMLLPPNAPMLSGQAGIRSFYEMMFQLFRVDDVSFDADEMHVA